MLFEMRMDNDELDTSYVLVFFVFFQTVFFRMSTRPRHGNGRDLFMVWGFQHISTTGVLGFGLLNNHHKHIIQKKKVPLAAPYACWSTWYGSIVTNLIDAFKSPVSIREIGR